MCRQGHDPEKQVGSALRHAPAKMMMSDQRAGGAQVWCTVAATWSFMWKREYYIYLPPWKGWETAELFSRRTQHKCHKVTPNSCSCLILCLLHWGTVLQRKVIKKRRVSVYLYDILIGTQWLPFQPDAQDQEEDAAEVTKPPRGSVRRRSRSG